VERTVPTTESEEIELYTRTYYSLLRSTADIQIRTLEEVHTGMKSLLHPGARQPQPDMSAFIYCLLRMPADLYRTNLVVLGQSSDVFLRTGFDLNAWQEVAAAARRRRCYFNGRDTLACYIASRSDIDDIIPILTAYQIEWNKLHRLLARVRESRLLQNPCRTAVDCQRLADLMEIPVEDLDRLMAVWDQELGFYLREIAAHPMELRVRLLSGSLSEYRRATLSWWENIERAVKGLANRPVYFISSNIHSTVNLLTGFALRQVEQLEQFLKKPGNAGLFNEWRDIQAQRLSASSENFLYYVYRKYEQSPEGRHLRPEREAHERRLGVVRVPGRRSFDVEAQVFYLRKLDPAYFDPRLSCKEQDCLEKSDALLVNVDYPLGLAAYNILSEVAANVGSVLGVYVMGKAATLNGVVGDVMIPNVVHDEHSQNTYLFPNCIEAKAVSANLIYGTVLDNQKAVTVQGTFLQNADYMDVFYREGYTDIEMEAGPYLSAIYEMYRPKRHPVNEIVNLYGLPFDLGLVHYASDTPLGKGRNLGAGSLSYYGMDSAYAVSLAILKRIVKMEKTRSEL
jgi:hypothetical protein